MLALFQRLLQSLFLRAESVFNAVFGERLNPLYHLGALSYWLFWVVLASGLYLYAFFDTGVTGAFASVERLTHEQRWVGGLMYRNGDIEESGVAAGVLGHPALGIAWLANKVGRFGTALEPGHFTLSGSFIRPVWANKGDTLRADFGPLGTIGVQFV